MQLIILEKFHVFDPPDSNNKRVFEPSMLVDASDIPADQSAQAWIAKGLAREAQDAPVDNEQ